ALPGGDFRILEAYLLALRSARRLIYIENQFLWSPEIMAVLREHVRQPPSDEFRLVLLLPAKPNNGGDDTRGHLSTLLEADAGAGRVLACTLLSPDGADGNPIYVHAKIGIVDDAWITVGSANLNEHSLFNDTELNVVIHDAGLVRQTRLRLWAEHLDKPVAEIDGDTTEVIDDLWRRIATNQAWRRENHLPPTHRLTLLPQLSKRAGLLLGPLQGLTVDA
ncbi:MAG: phospholipase D-like domain-containing protein, partial [Candidatus Dormibacteraeota bacterium]|nr:phospholipase D-like domain-containing protein [Candidatus Dormibacteraeota bacterium]